MPPKAAPPASTVSKKAPTYPPNQTLYITNLPSSKIRKYDLRLSLYTLFSTYGPVLDVVALRTQKMRGQAHIVFRDIQTATQAMRALQNFVFFGMEMQIQYAKSKSDTISKLDGTFHKSAAAAGAVTATELQQSIFNVPPSASAAATTTQASSAAMLKPPGTSEDQTLEDARSPVSVAGQKRRRDDDDEDGEDDGEEDGEEDGDGSEGEAAMEEDSDDD